jgi:hypothetical protein
MEETIDNQLTIESMVETYEPKIDPKEIERMNEIRNLIASGFRLNTPIEGRNIGSLNLTQGLYRKVLEEWLYLKIKNYTNIKEIDNGTFQYFDVYVDPYVERCNYFSGNIYINLYATKKNLLFRRPSDCISVTVSELFYNCSSVCISRLNSDHDLLSCDHSDRFAFTTSYLKILEELCDILGYSCILYTVSRESGVNVLKHVKENYKEVHWFTNKRTSNNVQYYVKNL